MQKKYGKASNQPAPQKRPTLEQIFGTQATSAASYEQAIEALKRADAAGNVEDATRLAKIAQSLKQQPQQQPASATGKFVPVDITRKFNFRRVAERVYLPVLFPLGALLAGLSVRWLFRGLYKN